MNPIKDTPQTMTPQEINKRIAEAVGWKCDPAWFTQQAPPNYYGDLNAMHEAEKTLTEIRLLDYHDLLCWEAGSVTRSIHATAAQRAEAFLRTIGKWEDGE